MTDFPLRRLLTHSMHGTIVYLDTYIYHKNPPKMWVKDPTCQAFPLQRRKSPFSLQGTQVGVLVLQLAINWDRFHRPARLAAGRSTGIRVGSTADQENPDP